MPDPDSDEGNPSIINTSINAGVSSKWKRMTTMSFDKTKGSYYSIRPSPAYSDIHPLMQRN
jgi:hypothetical protein